MKRRHGNSHDFLLRPRVLFLLSRFGMRAGHGLEDTHKMKLAGKSACLGRTLQGKSRISLQRGPHTLQQPAVRRHSRALALQLKDFPKTLARSALVTRCESPERERCCYTQGKPATRIVGMLQGLPVSSTKPKRRISR